MKIIKNTIACLLVLNCGLCFAETADKEIQNLTKDTPIEVKNDKKIQEVQQEPISNNPVIKLQNKKTGEILITNQQMTEQMKKDYKILKSYN